MAHNKNWAQHFSSPEDRAFTSPQPIPPAEFLFQDLLEPGGGEDMNVDGSVTPVNFSYTVPAGFTFMLHRFVIHMVDGGITWDGFGALSALTNGIAATMYDADNTPVIALENIYTTYDLGHFGGGSANLTQGSGTEDNILASMDLHDLIGYVLMLPEGWKVEVRIQDNLTALTHLESWVTGRLIPNDAT